MQRIVPNIWCQRTAADAGAFYASVFPDAGSEIVARYPEEGLPDFQREFAGRELVVDVTIRDYRLRLINAGGEFRPNPAISFVVPVEQERVGGAEAARAEIDRMWAALGEGGTVRMALDRYDHSPYYGWVEDRYGVNWQLMVTEPDGQDRPAIIPQVMFTGSEPQAADAITFYIELFGDPPPSMVIPSPSGVGFAAFTLAGQWMSALDGGAAHDFTFTPGVSLEVSCVDQAEIDRLWEALSAVPEAEQCGWLADRYGVSWQIVPEAIGELMQRPGAHQALMDMKKIVIDEF